MTTRARTTPAKKAATAKGRRKTTAKKAAAKKTPAAAKTAPPPRRRGRKPPPDPRLLQVLELRRSNISFATIATELKFPDEDAAFAAFEQAMQMLHITSVANQRQLDRERLDRLAAIQWPKALRGDGDALDRLMRILDQRAAVPPALDDRKDRQLGPVEEATSRETAKLAKHAPALAAAALTIARAVDDNASDLAAAALASRELRISMTQLRGLAGTRVEDEDEGTPKPPSGGVVVPPSRLEELRREADSGPGSA